MAVGGYQLTKVFSRLGFNVRIGDGRLFSLIKTLVVNACPKSNLFFVSRLETELFYPIDISEKSPNLKNSIEKAKVKNVVLSPNLSIKRNFHQTQVLLQGGIIPMRCY